jgi:hypothetical protein
VVLEGFGGALVVRMELEDGEIFGSDKTQFGLDWTPGVFDFRNYNLLEGPDFSTPSTN